MTRKSTPAVTSDVTMDVAVVLGAGVWEGGVPSPALRRRVSHGVELVKSGSAGWLILTGGVGRYPPSEAQVMRELAVKKGLPEEQIILEEKARATFENALLCSRIIKSRGLSSAWVVSDRYHLLRSVFLFRQLGISAEGSPANHTGSGIGRCRLCYLYLRELLALLWSVFRLLSFKASGRYKR